MISIYGISHLIKREFMGTCFQSIAWNITDRQIYVILLVGIWFKTIPFEIFRISQYVNTCQTNIRTIYFHRHYV